MENRLKFRCWDKRDVRWLPVEIFGVQANGHGMHHDGMWRSMDTDRFVIQQFTGLYDKNNVPIYEGDILPARYNTGNVVVVWDTALASFELQDRAGDDFGYSEHLLDVSGEHDLGYNPWEVLGNIFESPELVRQDG